MPKRGGRGIESGACAAVVAAAEEGRDCVVGGRVGRGLSRS